LCFRSWHSQKPSIKDIIFSDNSCRDLSFRD
jgi:hypothetical protein